MQGRWTRTQIEQKGYALLGLLAQELQRTWGFLGLLRTTVRLNEADMKPGIYHYLLDIHCAGGSAR